MNRREMVAAISGAAAEHGWSDADIRQVPGQNWLRVYEKAW